MKTVRNNEIQIYHNILIDHKEKRLIQQNKGNINYDTKQTHLNEFTYTNTNINNVYEMMMKSQEKNNNDIDKLIEESNKEFDINLKIKQYKEKIENINEERKKQELIDEEKNNKIMNQLILDNDALKKREKMNYEFEKKLKLLEDKKNMELEKERLEQKKRLEKIEEERLEQKRRNEEDLDKRKKLYKELEKKDEELYEVKMKYMNENEKLKKKHYEQMIKMSKDLTEQNKKYLQMRNDFYKIENQNKILSLDNNKLKNINQLNEEYIQHLHRKNNPINNYTNYTSDYNNSINHYNNLGLSQSFSDNSNI